MAQYGSDTFSIDYAAELQIWNNAAFDNGEISKDLTASKQSWGSLKSVFGNAKASFDFVSGKENQGFAFENQVPSVSPCLKSASTPFKPLNAVESVQKSRIKEVVKTGFGVEEIHGADKFEDEEFDGDPLKNMKKWLERTRRRFSKNLRTLKLFRCSGDWDKLLEVIADRVDSMAEVHLERIQVSDLGLSVLSKCANLEVLHLVKTPECTNIGLIEVAEKCRLLRKLHIDGWKTNRISDDGLIVVATYCPNLQELVLIGVNPTRLSLEKLATNCQNLERLALCGSETVGDTEISCIAAKCYALKKLCIKSCPVSDHGMEALAGGYPNLVKVKVKKCRGVTSEGADCG